MHSTLRVRHCALPAEFETRRLDHGPYVAEDQDVMTKFPGDCPPTVSVRRFTLIELLIVVALIGILSAIAAPFLIAAKSSANEASAVQSLRTLVSAQSTFSTVCGGGGYATSL